MPHARAGPGETNMQRHTAYQLSAVAISVVAQASWAQCLVDGWRPIFPAAMGPANGPVDTLLTTGAPGSQITYAGGSFTQIAG
jgi:hypothetical protein